jgi:hypothetical protein
VRFAGEVPLCRPAQALRDGGDVAAVPGLTTRAGDGLPAPVLDGKPMALHPLRDELPEILGHRAAHILATRGCAGRCGYCAPAALQSQEQKEGVRAGLRVESLHQAGVGHVRRRPVEDLCDEMAALWHGQGVRYFYFVDEHMLPYQEPEALAFLEGLRLGLRRRKVGRLGIGTMLRADRLTGKIVRAFAEVGLVRAFVGVELPSCEEGHRYGRSCDPGHTRDILAVCEESGVAVVSHVMLVHPESTRDTIANAIRFLETVPAGVFEVTEMRVYHGTTLWRRMAEAGRLEGNPLRYGYSFHDATVARFSEIFRRLRAEAFWNHSIAYRTHDAFLAHALGCRLRPGLGDIPSSLDEIRRQVGALYVDAYRKALALAESGMGGLEADFLVAGARAQSLRLQERLDESVHELARRLHASPQIFSPGRAAATGAIAFAFLGGTLAGCHPGGLKARRADAGMADVADRLRETGPEVAADAAEAARDAGPESGCTPAMEEEQRRRYVEAATQAAPCMSLHILPSPTGTQVLPGFDMLPIGYYTGPICGTIVDGGAVFKANESSWIEQVKTATAGLEHSCINYRATQYEVSIDVRGAAEAEAKQIGDARFMACGDEIEVYPRTVTITIDGDGRVTGSTGLSNEVAECLHKALEGLVFPCLAGNTICQEEYILLE